MNEWMIRVYAQMWANKDSDRKIVLNLIFKDERRIVYE